LLSLPVELFSFLAGAGAHREQEPVVVFGVEGAVLAGEPEGDVGELLLPRLTLRNCLVPV